jgi:hypothetical protein
VTSATMLEEHQMVMALQATLESRVYRKYASGNYKSSSQNFVVKIEQYENICKAPAISKEINFQGLAIFHFVPVR